MPAKQRPENVIWKILLIACWKPGLDARSQFQENEQSLFTQDYLIFKMTWRHYTQESGAFD